MTTNISVFDGHNDVLLRLYKSASSDVVTDFLGGEDAGHRGKCGVAVEQLEVAGELLDAVDLAATLDLHRDRGAGDAQRRHEHDHRAQRAKDRAFLAYPLNHANADLFFRAKRFFCFWVADKLDPDHRAALPNIADALNPIKILEAFFNEPDLGLQFR